MNSKDNPSQTITTRLDLGWGRILFEYDPRALASAMARVLAEKLTRSCPDAGDLSDLTHAAARRGIIIFNEKLADELTIHADTLMVTAISAAYEEFNTRTLALGAKSQDVRNINAQLYEHISDIRRAGRSLLWGDPTVGRTRASPFEKQQRWEHLRAEFLKRCTKAILEVDAAGDPLSQVNVARRVYQEGQKLNTKKVRFTSDLKMFKVDFNKFCATVRRQALGPN